MPNAAEVAYEVEAAVNQLVSLPFSQAMRLYDEIRHWQFAVEQDLISQAEAEERATRRAATILHRLAAQ